MCLVPGPLDLHEPAFSFAINESEDYSPQTIAEAILAVPGCRLMHPGVPEWSDWKASWNNGQFYIDLEFEVMEVDPEYCNGLPLIWSGSFLKVHCLVSEVIAFWSSIRSRCPGVWLHDAGCRMWSPKSFLERNGN
jgi:hypothetical protein